MNPKPATYNLPAMPVNKNALLRYRIIDSCLTNSMHPFPDAAFMLDKIQEQIGTEISESMLNKDLACLKREFGAPIKFDRNRGGYFYSDKNYSFKKLPLSNEEIEALDFSTALLQQLKGTDMFRHFENAINKLIEGYRISKIIGKNESAILQTELPVDNSDSRWLETIITAILHKKTLNLQYQPFGRDAREHTLSPYLLKEYRNRWYVVGYSEQAENILVFALDRIKEIDDAASTFRSDENFNGAKFFEYSLGITQVHDQEPEDIELAFQPLQAEYIRSQPLHQSQHIISENENEVLIQLKLFITQELVMAILSYGAAVRVLKPESLKNRIKEEVKALGKIYEKS
ncbi:MAG: WYL domain-containing protein [Chitinophagaceae bacterium]|nr:WYL domain-containing protein [Chitinophagaceae bacterium]